MRNSSFLSILLTSCICTGLLGGCSSKVRTNKIPNEKKYTLPKKTSNELKEQALDSKELQGYSQALEEFFKRKFKQDEEKDEIFDVYQIGIDKGYFK